jgi:hypothetical protein
MTRCRKLLPGLFAVGVSVLFGSFVSQAQSRSSDSLVEELKQLMDDQELGAIAAQDPSKTLTPTTKRPGNNLRHLVMITHLYHLHDQPMNIESSSSVLRAAGGGG